MSIPVELGELRERVTEYGPIALLVSVGAERRPHVVSVAVELSDGALVAGAGRTTSANIADRPDVTVVWPAAAGGDYCLIVDGAARVREDGAGPQAVIEPVRAVLHRLAGADAALPSCITILDLRADRQGGE